MKFEASIKVNKLHDALEALSVVVDEAKFVLGKEGITSHMGDARDVLEVLLKIKKEAFQSWDYAGAPQEIALIGFGAMVNKLADLRKVLWDEASDIYHSELPMEQKHKSLKELSDRALSLTIDDTTNTILLSTGDFTYRKHLSDSASIRQISNISINLPILVQVNGAKLRNALLLIEQDSDYAKFDAIDGKLIISSGKEKEDSSPQIGYVIQALNIFSAEVHGLYSMDYLLDLKNQIGKAEVVSLWMANDYLIKIEYSLYHDSIEIEYTLAPRVEA